MNPEKDEAKEKTLLISNLYQTFQDTMDNSWSSEPEFRPEDDASGQTAQKLIGMRDGAANELLGDMIDRLKLYDPENYISKLLEILNTKENSDKLSVKEKSDLIYQIRYGKRR